MSLISQPGLRPSFAYYRSTVQTLESLRKFKVQVKFIICMHSYWFKTRALITQGYYRYSQMLPELAAFFQVLGVARPAQPESKQPSSYHRVTVFHEMPTWIPRHELALPNELLYNIISWVLVNSVHSICVSTGDVSWEKDVMNILCDVSPAFRAIAMEVVAKAFEIRRETDEDEERLFPTLQQIFIYLHQLGARLRDPSHWATVSFQVMDCTVSPYVFAYALYLSCISLRRNAGRSPRDVFEATHQVVLSALAQSEALCKLVYPMNMTDLIRDKIQDEFKYARAGIVIVQSFHELNEYAESMIILHPNPTSARKNGTGPLAGARSLIHRSLSKFEAVCEGYSCHIAGNTPSQDPRIYELPGVLPALRKAHSLTFEEDEYNLRERIQRLVDMWIDGCPFFNKKADTSSQELM